MPGADAHTPLVNDCLASLSGQRLESPAHPHSPSTLSCVLYNESALSNTQVQIFFSLLSSIALKYDESTLRDATNMDALLTIFTALPIFLTIYLESPLRQRQTAASRSPPLQDELSDLKLERPCAFDPMIEPDEAYPDNTATSPGSVVVQTRMESHRAIARTYHQTCQTSRSAATWIAATSAHLEGPEGCTLEGKRVSSAAGAHGSSSSDMEGRQVHSSKESASITAGGCAPEGQGLSSAGTQALRRACVARRGAPVSVYF